MSLSEKFISKYMRMAKQVGEDKNPCYSRKIGVVLVKVYPDGGGSRVVGTGYNGPPRNTPHCDNEEYLEEIVWPQLTTQEKVVGVNSAAKLRGIELCVTADKVESQPGMAKLSFLTNAEGCQTCPRRLIGAPSGERLELCSCEHGERNAIANSCEDLRGCWAFCWCGVACWDCAKLMIQVGIKKAFFIDDGSYARNGGSDYSFGSRWLFEKAGVEIEVRKPDTYLE